jgi:SAM-dependent methyltransferase
MNATSGHYDSTYFEWQRTIGEFGGWANAPRFARHIKPSDTVLDFGCGGGYLLSNLPGAHKLGVEVNEAARTVARQNGAKVFESIASVSEQSVDVIVSNHCLEHVPNPFGALVELRSKLKPGGRVVFVVPCEKASMHWGRPDADNHLYTFTPMCLGNLFKEAGYTVLSSKVDRFRWPPKYRLIAKVGGRVGFELACKLWYYIDRRYTSQVRLVAQK